MLHGVLLDTLYVQVMKRDGGGGDDDKGGGWWIKTHSIEITLHSYQHHG